MMEFTFDGMVRSGYGFYNPNHAAALICALLPFLWEWCYRTADRKLLRLIPLLLTLLLTAALVFTFSRTGMAVMILEGILFGVLKRKIGWKWIGAFAIVTLLLLALSGMWMRFRIDEAVMNRPKIWLAGLQLSAANPLGVGWGNSGRLASAFLLPDGIQCRTLVNSHLTFLAEYGMLFGFFWFSSLFYAFSQGIRKTACFCSLAGLSVSAFSSTVFDPGTLFDFRDFGNLPLLNFVLSWGLFLFYFALLVICSWGRFQWRKSAVAALGSALLLLISFILFQTPEAPCRKGEFLVRKASPMSAFVYDSEWSLKELRAWLKNGWIIPLHNSVLPKPDFPEKVERVYLFGEMCVLADHFPDPELYFINPPDYVDLPENLKGVFLPPWTESLILQGELSNRGISVLPFPESWNRSG